MRSRVGRVFIGLTVLLQRGCHTGAATRFAVTEMAMRKWR